MFLVPTGILAALVAREETGRGQHVRTSLFQGALLFTTQIWTYVENARADFFGTMAKTYPPGVHQEMIFEVADDEWVHTSIMSGLDADQEPGRDRRRRRARPTRRGTRCSRPRSARRSRRCAAPAYKARERDELIDEFRENNHAIEAIDTMEAALGAERRAARAARRQRHGRDGRGSRARARPRRSACRSTCSARRARSRGRARARASTTTRSSATLGYSTDEIRTHHERAEVQLMHALEGVVVVDFGQYLAGPVRPDDHRRPRRRRHQGRAGHRRRHAHGEPAVLRLLSAASATSRSTSRAEARSRDRARARRAGRHRAPQHDRRRREAARHRVRRLQARQSRRRLLQHLGVRPRGSARALRRPRPAVPGRGRARVRGGPGARRATRRSTSASA